MRLTAALLLLMFALISASVTHSGASQSTQATLDQPY
jgi:hypothetical protein